MKSSTIIRRNNRACKLFGFLFIFLLLSFLYIALIRPYIYKLYYKLSYEEIIIEYSYENNLKPSLVAAIVFCESSFRSEAKSGAGAVGLMQLMPATAKECSEQLGFSEWNDEMLLEPAINIRLGCHYLRSMISSFSTMTNTLAAYNAGPGRTREWISKYGVDELGNLNYIPYPETEKYVSKVFAAEKAYSSLYPELNILTES